MANIVLAADLGGTNLRLAAVARDGSILHTARSSTPEAVSPEQLLDMTAEMAAECRGVVGGGHTICGIGFASPAPAARESEGILTKLPNLPTLNGMNLREGLERVLDLPATLENDATAAAIGEHRLGASKGTDNSILVTLGTGVGGGLIIDGEPFRGIDGTAGEIGHVCVEPDGRHCGCGSHGCIEQYASATAIVRLANEAGMDVDSARQVYEAWQAGDETALGVFRSMGRYLGITLAGLINVLNPEMIVVGGGVAAGFDAFAPFVRNEIDLRAFSQPAARVSIVPTKLGDNAGLLGVAFSAFERSDALPDAGLR